MTARRPFIQSVWTALLAALLTLGIAAGASAQGRDPGGRLVREVRIEGLSGTPETLIRNTIRTEAGDAYDAETIRQDIVHLTFLGRFDTVEAAFEDNNDGSVNVIFRVSEQPRLASIRFVGAKQLKTEELLVNILLQPGDPIDHSLIDRGTRSIEQAYEEKGYFATSVSYDETALKDNRELIYRIVEGPRVRIESIRFEGNSVYTDDQLESQVSSEEELRLFFIRFVSGHLDRTKLDIDVAKIRAYYRDRGYLDAQIGRRIELSPRQNRAVVTFEINEGPQYTVRNIGVQFTQGGAPTTDQLMSEEQIRSVVRVVRGGVYADDRLSQSEEAVKLWYGEIGFINTDVRVDRVFIGDQPQVDVIVTIDEGSGPTYVGDVQIIGLSRTDQKVLLRRVRGLEPGRPVNLRGLNQTENLVRESIWFANGRITRLGDEDDPVRDFLIEASEKNTGSFNIGAGISSDSGLFGAISLEQRNFDITDWPESWSELRAGRAFIGGGQTFNITLAPGNENSAYSIGFREPYLFESDYFFDFRASATQSQREDYDEQRLGVRSSVGRRLGDVWTGSARARVENVEVDDIDASAPVDVFAVAGSNSLTSLGFGLVRSTTDSNISPGRGSRLSVNVDQYGAMGGDYDFTRASLSYDKFWTLDQDFLGRRTILALHVDTGYIFQDTDDVPLFERFYNGGRGFRGFGYRGVGPRGIRNDTMLLGDDPVGGRFQFVSRLEYEVPVYENVVRWAFFTDQGTVQDDFGFDQWRVAVGTGVRLIIPFFGQAPIAIDFGFPLIDEQGDDTQILSFSVQLPFN